MPNARKLQTAVALQLQGQLAPAQALYEEILQTQPEHFDALRLLAVIAAQTGHSINAADLMGRAIAAQPNHALAFFYRASVLHETGQLEAAVASYSRAIELNPGFTEAYMKRGGIHYELERWEAGLADYTEATALESGNAEAHYHRALLLDRCGQLESAVSSYERAIEIRPDFPEASNNRANLLHRLKRWDEALAGCNQVIATRPDFAEAYINRAAVLVALKQFDGALASYDRALALKPDYPGLTGQRQHVRMIICDWTDLEAELLRLTARIERNEAASSPFHLLGLSGSAALQKRSAELWMLAMHPVNSTLPAIPRRGAHARIRIGYFSGDYHNHATMSLMGELFELHDRSNYEVTAFSFASEPHDAMRIRLEAACEVIDVSRQSDKATALLARNRGIDIAVDLKGFTDGGRPGIFTLRAAPVQVNYLGYPGTMGAQCMDYLIADRTLIPPGCERHYSERIVYLPDSYQVNDAKREIGGRAFTRAEVGLPESGVVFCCFNNSFKILPDTFDGWMRILERVEGSVLWLLDDNPQAVRNLRQAAELRHVPAERLIFAPRMPPAEHLARLRLADLLLDTQPCNAHTTASDALWAGVPVLTRGGEAFAGRVAASLLRAIDLSELIAGTAAQYEHLAVELGTHPKRLAILKQKLARRRLRTPLFDAPRYTRHLEAAYRQIHTRSKAGLPPFDIVVDGNGDHASRLHMAIP